MTNKLKLKSFNVRQSFVRASKDINNYQWSIEFEDWKGNEFKFSLSQEDMEKYIEIISKEIVAKADNFWTELKNSFTIKKKIWIQ